MGDGKKIRVGISIGDINGIGCEIVLKTFEDNRMLDFCIPVIFASNKIISQQKKDLDIDINFHGIHEASKALDNKINVVNVWKDAPRIEYGQATEKSRDFRNKILKICGAGYEE